MVVMVMADEHEVDRRQLLPPHGRRPHPPLAEPTERSGLSREYRIRQDVRAGQLEEKRGVPDESHRHLPGRHRRGQLRPAVVFHVNGPADAALRREPPLGQGGERKRLGASRWIKKTPPVAVIADRKRRKPGHCGVSAAGSARFPRFSAGRENRPLSSRYE